jgi:basic amino acid/polyamine antiporter, APA family
MRYGEVVTAVKRLFRKKFLEHILEEIDIETHRLHRTLNAFDLTVLGVGAIVGVGIFVLTGAAAARFAGPAVILSFLISGSACAFAALCYTELSSSIPVTGSAYNYAYATMGEIVAWIIGWDLILEYTVACIAVAIGISSASSRPWESPSPCGAPAPQGPCRARSSILRPWASCSCSPFFW